MTEQEWLTCLTRRQCWCFFDGRRHRPCKVEPVTGRCFCSPAPCCSEIEESVIDERSKQALSTAWRFADGNATIREWTLANQGTGSQLTKKKLHVLVVEDNSDAADNLCTLLRLWGYECRAAYDRTAGLQAACEYRPDCLVLDIDMPNLEGYRLARSLRAQPGLDRAKLVALTTYSDEAQIRCAREAGFDFHFVKPIGHLAIERLKRLLDKLV